MSIWKTKWGWRARVQVAGENYPAPGYFQYKSQAKAWREAEKARIKEALKAVPGSGTLELLYLVEKHLDEIQSNYSYKTYQEKLGSLERFLAHVGNVDPREVTPFQVADMLNARAKKASNNAANKDRKNIKAFYKWLQGYFVNWQTGEQILIQDPTGPIRPKPHETQGHRVIPIQDFFKVMMAAPMPERALIAVYWHTAGRKGEVLRWQWSEDVNFEGRWVRLGTRKNRDRSMRYEKLSMNDDLYKMLWSVWQNRDHDNPYVFPDYYQPDAQGNNFRGEQRAHRLLMGYARRNKEGELVRKGGLCATAGVERFGFHDIRKTVSVYLNDVEKVGIKRIQRLLRHRRQSTTEIYIDGDFSESRAVVDLLNRDTVEAAIKALNGEDDQAESQES